MARGGNRSGAGRKAGSANKKTREVADAAVRDGLTPLEVMLQAMRQHVSNEKWDAAASIAKDAAPYMHPKLSAIEHSGPNGTTLAPPVLNVSFVTSTGSDDRD